MQSEKLLLILKTKNMDRYAYKNGAVIYIVKKQAEHLGNVEADMIQTILQEQQKKEQLFRLLPGKIRQIFEKGNFDFSRLQEIRMRVENPLLVVFDGEEYMVTTEGNFQKNTGVFFRITAEDIRESLEYISNYSMYAFENELKDGYVTIAGGHRVGIAGKVLWESEHVKSMRHISFLNIRLAHEIKGCAAPVLPYLYGEDGLYHTLVISPPGCGKTTLLRDLIRQISDGTDGHGGMTVGVVDERSEIAACYKGQPQNDVGKRTDVLDDCPKSEGMMMLVRSMAPQVIAVDEIGSTQDVKAIRYIMNCGVKMLATVHGNSVEEVKRKPVLEELLTDKAFERFICLKSGAVGKIQGIYDKDGKLLS